MKNRKQEYMDFYLKERRKVEREEIKQRRMHAGRAGKGMWTPLGHESFLARR